MRRLFPLGGPQFTAYGALLHEHLLSEDLFLRRIPDSHVNITTVSNHNEA